MTLSRNLNRAAAEQPAKDKHSPTSQCARILKRLQQRGRITNVEMISMRILRGSERIRNLKAEGYVIKSNRVKGGLWEYVYFGHEDDGGDA